MNHRVPYLFQYFFLSLLLALSGSVVRAESEFLIKERVVPDEYQREFQFLELLKKDGEPTEGFSASDAPKWDMAKLMGYVAESGITFTDVNHQFEGTVTKAQIASQLKARKGKVFELLSHISHIYSIPYRQYSELKFSRSGKLAKIDIAGWYHITFIASDTGVQVTQIDYLQEEGGG